MCGSCGCGSGKLCGVCKTFSIIALILFTLTTVAAFMGVWMTHVTPAGWVFGSVAGSAALITFIISVVAWLKTSKKVCGCSSKGCGCGDGAGCDCGHDHGPSK